ncbi:MAG: DUF2269 domain-containing protein [Roseovarius sp.]|nr:DUF2269 domain-containing protein [Roseovarius sp.]
MPDTYLIAKTLYILSSTLLFGTGIGTAFQMVWAMRIGNVETIHSVAAGVVWADWIFTTPAGLVQPMTGLWLIHPQGYALAEPWLITTYLPYLVGFACCAPVVHLQIRIRNLAAEALARAEPLPGAARRAHRLWLALDWPAFGALIAVFWLMVTKPALW